MVLVFSFRLFLHFEFFFAWGAYGYPSSTELSFHICSKLIVHICVDLFLDSVTSIYLLQYYTSLISAALK